MVMVIHAGETVAAYVKQREVVAAIRPERCGACGSVGMWHGNGWYPRGIVWIGGIAEALEVRRLEFQGCGHTTSLLPDFLHRYRHYGLEVIEQVVSARVEEGVSWSKMAQRYSRDGASSLRTMRRWYAAFVQPLLQALDPLPLDVTLAHIKHHLKVAGHNDAVTLFSDDALKRIAEWSQAALCASPY